MGIYRFELDVLGVPISIYVFAFSNVPSSTGAYIRSNVLHTCIVLFTRSISFHCKAHNSPILIPEHMAIKIPRLRGEGLSNAYSTIFLYSSGEYRSIFWEVLLFLLGHTIFQVGAIVLISSSSLANWSSIFKTISISLQVFTASPLSIRLWRNGTIVFLFNRDTSISPKVGDNFFI